MLVGPVLYDALFNRFLVRVPPESAHALAAAGVGALPRFPPLSRKIARASAASGGELAVEALGQRFSSPVGVAAGLDKNATWLAGLGALGFGSVEVGTVTPRAQPGRARPRIVRVPTDRALINAMGFPNDGAQAVAARLWARAAPSGVAGAPVVGANLGKNLDTPLERAAEDYVAVARMLAPVSDYLVINVSSPNTPGLRALEAVEALAPLVDAVAREISDKPLLVKISPDMADADVAAVAELVASAGLAGVIATNTTVDRGVLSPPGRAEVAWFEGGGVSGVPVAPRSLAVLALLRARLRETDAIIISVGGVSGADDVWARILAGATLVQAYTGFIYGGPAWPARVNHDLAARVRAAGAGSIQELVGAGLS